MQSHHTCSTMMQMRTVLTGTSRESSPLPRLTSHQMYGNGLPHHISARPVLECVVVELFVTTDIINQRISVHSSVALVLSSLSHLSLSLSLYLPRAFLVRAPGRLVCLLLTDHAAISASSDAATPAVPMKCVTRSLICRCNVSASLLSTASC